MRVNKSMIRRLIREAVRQHLILEDDVSVAPPAQAQTQAETDRVKMLERNYDAAKVAYVLGMESLLSTEDDVGGTTTGTSVISVVLTALAELKEILTTTDTTATDANVRLKESLLRIADLLDAFVAGNDFNGTVSASLKSTPTTLSDELYSLVTDPAQMVELDIIKASYVTAGGDQIDLEDSDLQRLSDALGNLVDTIDGLNAAKDRLDTEKADIAERIEREQKVSDLLSALKEQQDTQAIDSFKRSFMTADFDYHQKKQSLDSVVSNLMKPMQEAEVAARKAFAEKYGDMSDTMTEIEDAVMSKDAITQALPTDGGMINTNLETIRDNLKDIVTALAAMSDDAPLSTADPDGPELTYMEDTLQMLTDLLGTDLESASIESFTGDDEETIDFSWIRSTREELAGLYNYHDADYKLPPIPEKKKPMASKKVASDWKSYVKKSDTKRKIMEAWKALAGSDGRFKSWVRWYNNFRKTGNTDTAIQFGDNYEGKKFGSKTHFSSKQVLDVLNQMRTSSLGAKPRVDEGLSRGSLYRKRYWGRY